MLDRIMEWMNRHWVITTLIVVWLLLVFTFTFVVGMLRPPDMNASVAAVLTSMIGLPTVAVGLWRFRKENDMKGDRNGSVSTKNGSKDSQN